MSMMHQTASETPGKSTGRRTAGTPATQGRRKLAREYSTVVILVAGVALIAVLLQSGSSDGAQNAAMNLLINVVLVVGLYVFSGTSGLLSFGHTSFMAIGAYMCGLLTMPVAMKSFLLPDLPGLLADANLPPVVAIAVAAAVTALLAGVVAVPLMRVSGIGASIITFALLLIVYVVLVEWDSVTGGAQSLNGVPTTSGTVGNALPWVIGVFVLAFLFQRSSIGMRLKATREDEVAARSLGIGMVRERVIAFALSAGVVAVGGGLYAFHVGSLDPTQFYLTTTFLMVMMLVVGGLHSLSGAVVGAVAISLLNEVLRAFETGESVGPISFQLRDGLADVVLALLLILTLMLRPEGIMGGRELQFPRRRRNPTT